MCLGRRLFVGGYISPLALLGARVVGVLTNSLPIIDPPQKMMHRFLFPRRPSGEFSSNENTRGGASCGTPGDSQTYHDNPGDEVMEFHRSPTSPPLVLIMCANGWFLPLSAL